MGNRIGRIVLGLIIAIAALVVIYLVLPGGVKHPMQEWFQKTFQSDTYAIAEKYQQTKVPNTDMTFGTMIANCSNGSHAWVVDVLSEADDKSFGDYEVHAYVTKVDLSMDQENGQENLKSYSQVSVEILFAVRKNSDGSFVTTSYSVLVEDEALDNFYRSQALMSMVGDAEIVQTSEAK